MSTVPAHIQMIMKLPVAKRTDEERQMLADFQNGKGDYAKGNTFDSSNVRSLHDDGGHWLDKKGGGKWGYTARCYESHPALRVALPEGGEGVVYGGSCGTPIVPDADIYIGLDYNMKAHPQRLPWTNGHAIHYEIKDGGIPKDVPEFRALIEWTADRIREGRKVHVGCIGGHGRTGTVLAALVRELDPDIEDAIGYVRQHYCKKAVESTVQVDMLVKHFGCKTAMGTKAGLYSGSLTKGQTQTKSASETTVTPVEAGHALWPEYEVVK